MSSAYLDSDSEPDLGGDSDSSDADLPVTDICSPSKAPRPPSESAQPTTSTNDSRGGPSISTSTLIPSTAPAKPSLETSTAGSRPLESLTVNPASPVQVQASLSLLQSPATKLPIPFQNSTPSPSYASHLSALSHSPSPSQRLLERHEKDLRKHRMLTRKVEKMAGELKSKNDKKTKLEAFRSKGGIRGISRHIEQQVRSTSSDPEDDATPMEASGGGVAAHAKHPGYAGESNRFPFPLSAPGISLLVHPPHLITELYPPGLDDVEGGEGPFNLLEVNLMGQQDPDVLSQLICQRWFLLCYRIKPCPTVIWQWLFQITCLSCDHYLAERAYANLVMLIEWACDKGVVYVPTPHSVLDVLVSMGADKALLEAASLGILSASGEATSLALSSAEVSDDVFQPSPPMLPNLSNLLRYLSRAFAANPAALNSDDAVRLFLMLCYLSLDSVLNKNPDFLAHVSSCLPPLVASLPEDSWESSGLLSLASQLVSLSSHHHDWLQLTRLLLPSSQRMKQLQKAACKETIWKTAFPDTPLRPLSDCSFMWTVVKQYYDTPAAQFEYYSMYTMVCLLTQLFHLCSPEWPSEDMKHQFKSMLSKLGRVKIRDSAESVERAPVKDLLISMSLEMATQRSKDSLQTDLFAHFRQ